MVKLVTPSSKYKISVLKALNEFKIEKKHFRLRDNLAFRNFRAYVRYLTSQASGKNLPMGYVPSHVFWLVNDNEYLGEINIRHELNDNLRLVGGHIGYKIRPSVRNRGYGSLILKLGLKEAKKIGLKKVLLTCDKTNIGSKKIIEKNGGIFEDEILWSKDKPPKLRYWIDIYRPPVAITAKIHPDIDAVAGIIAYQEYLTKQGQKSEIFFYQEPQIEACYILNKLNFNIVQKRGDKKKPVILVDSSPDSLKNMPEFIKPENVIEVIDHRQILNKIVFKNARIQVEKIGAAATQIAEKFFQKKIKPSERIALLLAAAIKVHTQLLKSHDTTKRDKRAYNLLVGKKLKKRAKELSAEIIKYKTNWILKNLNKACFMDSKEFGGIGIMQLELYDGEKNLRIREKELIEILRQYQISKQLTFTFLFVVDINHRQNAYFVPNKKNQVWLTEKLKIKFANNWSINKGLLMRKNIVPKLV